MKQNNTYLLDDGNTYFSCLDNGFIEIDDSSAYKPGDRLLGKYKVLELFDKTQFGFLYLVQRFGKEEKKFILKEFFPQAYVVRGKSNNMLRRASLNIDELVQFSYMERIFATEMMHLKKIMHHPHQNIIRPVEVIEKRANTSYIVFPYEEGAVTLKKYLEEKHREKLDKNGIFQILDPILDALDHLHKLKIYHFDIKPEKIFVKNDRSILLSGFETSFLFHNEEHQEFCNAFTPRYAAPEQLRIPKNWKVDQRADIYALGVLCYFLITNTFPPTAQERIDAIEDKNGKDPYIPLEEQKYAGKYDINLIKVINRSLQFSYKKRPYDIDEFHAILKTGQEKKKTALYAGLGGLAALLILFIYLGVKTSSTETSLLHKSEMEQYTSVKDENNTKEKILNKEKKENQHMYVAVTQEKNSSEQIATQKNDKNISHEILEDGSKNTAVQIPLSKQPTREDIEVALKETIEKKVSRSQKNEVVTAVQESNISEVKSQDEVEIKIETKVPKKRAKTKITMNGKVVDEGNITVYRGETYHIIIENPCCKKIEVERTFDQLLKFPKQTFVLTKGEGKLYLEGLPENVQISMHNESSAYQRSSVMPEYNAGIYEITVDAGEMFYLEFNKEGYQSTKTEKFMLEEGKALTLIQTLKKKDEPKMLKTVLSKTTKNVMEHKIKKDIKRKPIKKKAKTEKISKKDLKESKNKSKIKKTVKKKSSIKNVKKPTVPKKINNGDLKVNKKADNKMVNAKIDQKESAQQNQGNTIWYCSVKIAGKTKISMKNPNKAIAKSKVIQECKRKNRDHMLGCSVVKCFLMRN